MQVEVIFTGIGGQGVQLIAKTLALAANAEGRQAMLVPSYGGEVRGGKSEASVVVADGDLRAPPILASTWSAVVLHSDWWEPVRSRLRPGGIVVANSTLVAGGELGVSRERVFCVPATGLAASSTGVMTAGLLLLGAYISATGLVSLDSAVGAMKEIVPRYRARHLEANEQALRLGVTTLPALVAAAPLQPLAKAGRP